MLDGTFEDATLPDTPENRRRISNLVSEISAIEASGYGVIFPFGDYSHQERRRDLRTGRFRQAPTPYERFERRPTGGPRTR